MVTDPLSAALVTALGSIVDGVVQHLVVRGADTQSDRRRLRQLLDVDRMVRSVTDDLEGLRHNEFNRWSNQRWESACRDVAQMLHGVRWTRLDAVDFVDADRLFAVVEQNHPDLDEAHRVIARVCCAEFTRRARSHATIRDKLAVESFIELHNRRIADQVSHDAFTSSYLDFLARDVATFELFQVIVGRGSTGQSFTEFYAMPAFARRQPGSPAELGDDLTGIGTDAARAIRDTRRLALLGGAGAGKTTFLRWLTHVSAVRDPQAPWPDAVPFLLSLRRFAGRRAAGSTGALLPRVDELLVHTAPMLAGGAPAGWANALFAQGRALLLVDGMDELIANERAEATGWLDLLIRSYPDARCVVTSRPSAVDQHWLADALPRFELLALSANGVRDVIHRWYAAARALETEPEQARWLADCEARLLASLVTRPRLRSLVASPLLCSLLCALYRRGNMSLPRNHRELLEAALKLLLVDWDETRRLVVDGGIELSIEEQLVLLQRFAASLVHDRQLLVAKDVAHRRLAHAMRGLRSHAADPADLLQQILERTGLLREHPDDHSVQFVHRTFRDYLAATEMLNAQELDSLVAHAHEDSWSEVVFMAVAQARPRERATLLRGLLERAAQRRKAKDEPGARRFELVAAASLDYADVVDPDTVREAVEQAVRRHIPPATDWDAELLAKAGDFVLNLLPKPAELAELTTEHRVDGQAIRIVLTAALIGGQQAGELIALYAEIVDVMNPLLRAWRGTDFSEGYAREVLAEVDFGDKMLPVRRFEVLAKLHLLTKLRAVHLIGTIDPLDALADIPALRHLELANNERATDLTPLRRCRALTRLHISGLNAVRDLSPLSGSTVTDLILRPRAGSTGPDLATLAGAGLRRLEIRHDDLNTGLHAIPADLPLNELVIGNRAERRSLDGLERFAGLRHLVLSGPLGAAERAITAALPRLRVTVT